MLLSLAPSLALLPLSQALILPRTLDSPATKDATIGLSPDPSCTACLNTTCLMCRLGHNQTFQATTTAQGIQSVALVGFQLRVPPSQVRSCWVQFPAFKKLPTDPVDLVFEQAVDADWDEATVSGNNAPPRGPVITLVHVDALHNMPAVDLTSACQSARADGQFSVYMQAVTGSVEIWSNDMNSPAILHTV